MPNTNFQTIHQMGSAISNVVKQATGRDPVGNIDMDYVTVAQNKTIDEMTISGNPASFQTGNAVPIQRLLIGMNPKQAGSGDPSPENVRPISGWTGLNVIRTGRNLIDDSIKYLYETNYIGIGNEYAFTVFLKAGQYTFSVEFLNNAHYGAYYREANDSANSVIWTPASSTSVKTFTIEKDGMYRLWLYSSSSVSVDNVGKCQLELGASATSYEPYSGTTIPIVFPALGKNLLDENLIEIGSYNASGVAENNGNEKYRRFAISLPAGSYVFSTTLTDCYITRMLVNDVLTPIGLTANSYNFSLENDAVVKFSFRNSTLSNITESFNSQIERGNTASSYEEYTNTVYGGTLDLTTGALTVKWAMDDMGDLDWEINTNGTYSYFTTGNMSPGRIRTAGEKAVICEQYKGIANMGAATFRNADRDCEICFNSGISTGYRLLVQDARYETAEAFSTAVNGIKVVTKINPNSYPTYQLTPQQVQTLVGDNVIFTDGDTLEIMYYQYGEVI